MSRFLLLGLSLALATAGHADASTSNPPPSLPASRYSVNVQNFGAEGDGVADDTQAIQNAVNAAQTKIPSWTTRVLHWDHLTKGSVNSPDQEIVFPAGTYKVSRPIVFGRFVSLRGIDRVVIQATDPSQDVFYFHSTQRAIIDNLNFQGGKTQLRVWTNNIGPATLAVSHCTFADSSDFAVECRSYTKEWGDLRTIKPWAPYQVEWADGVPKLTANSAEGLKSWFNSTLTTISDCRFDNTGRGIDLGCDTAAVRDCQFVTTPKLVGAYFRFAGNIHLYNVRALAKLAPGAQPFWIETAQGSDCTLISVRDSAFDTDGRGISLLHSNLPPVAVGIVVENTKIKSAGSPEGAVVWIEKNSQPNFISLRSLTEISGKPVKAVAWEQVPDAATLEKIKDQPPGAASNLIYKLEFANPGSTINPAIPAIFEPLLQKPVPQPALEKTYVPKLGWNYATLEAAALKNGAPLLAADVGVVADSKADNTAAVQKAFEVAGETHRLLVFPPGPLIVCNTITLPPNVVARGAGVTSFVFESREKDMFSAAKAAQIGFKNFAFNGGRDGFQITTEAKQKARLAFDNCAFFDQADDSIQALAGKGQTAEVNQTAVSVQGGIFGALHALTTNAAQAQIVESWAINDPKLDNDGFIRNLGGKMRIADMLFNPKLWQGKRSEGKVPPGITDWQWSKNTRWVDNWGQFYSLDTRFGGECGGMCVVYNRSESGTVFVGGGLARFYNGATRKTILYLEKTPATGVLHNVACPPVKVEEAESVMRPDGSNAADDPAITVRGVPAP